MALKQTLEKNVTLFSSENHHFDNHRNRSILHRRVDVLFHLFFLCLNPLVTNGFSHPYYLDEIIFIFRDIGSNISFLFHFSMKFVSANRIAPDGMPSFSASHLGLFCLHMSH